MNNTHKYIYNKDLEGVGGSAMHPVASVRQSSHSHSTTLNLNFLSITLVSKIESHKSKDTNDLQKFF